MKKDFSYLKKIVTYLFLISLSIILVSCYKPTTEQEFSGKTQQVEQPQVATQSVPEQPTVQQNDDVVQAIVEPEQKIIKSGQIVDGEYNVSATVNLYDDNRIELVNFNYNGRAPDVYIAIGNKTDGGVFQKIKLVTDKLEGKHENQSIIINVESSESFNAVSVYCDAYSEDFGSTVLN